MISAAIVSFNEAEKLERCLESIRDFVDEIVIVDLGSKDETKNVCEKYGAKIFHHKFVPYVEKIRNFSISKASNEWILILDPDEYIPDSLKNELKKVSESKEYSAVNIPRKNIFFGKWITHTNWWPDKHVRFFQKGSVSWSQIHLYPKVSGKILELPAKEKLAIIHYGYSDISEFIDRQNRYAEVESEEAYEKGIRFSWISFFWWPARVFLTRFIKHQGYLDGIYGFVLTYLMMIYKITVLVKLWEKRNAR
ncbi:hypothetical protein A3B45_00205 [Candidatus Daviesbacteria bacterium RIFCSPLOWO2_01_FULL_39_12]|uniref:Glycosyltransferase 2-like domain-containing protein n=1 Tax=Candidatus Daviesbacteria bacterium RIFCSPLOWO2_01_FULL_39_12 TaxID=1797785 RepID=A0A1F5KNX0_9BACT|nr:MAG: hypothetical protein A3B45_00205 [Candidatus Daviesbacteria bacterium RIFCSPLOWO2_01_FULL_39_12]